LRDFRCWVGVRCEGTVAAGREVARGDRVSGMAASQAETVHHDIAYNMQVDTTHTEAMECARTTLLVRAEPHGSQAVR
jgi:chloramphenicol 3-O phosphotransferase